MKMKKAIYCCLLIIAALVVVAGAVVASGYFFPPPRTVVPHEVVMQGDEKKFFPGSEVGFGISFTLPLNKHITGVNVVPGKGAVVYGTPAVSGLWQWNRRKWDISFILRPYSKVLVPGGTLTVDVCDSEGRREQYELAVPEIDARKDFPVENNELILADSEELLEERNFWSYGTIAVAVLLITVWLVIVLIKHYKSVLSAMSPSQRAIHDLRCLKSAVNAEKVTVVDAYNWFSDIQKRYFNDEFHLPFKSRVSSEILFYADQNPGCMPDEFRNFCRNFISKCDMVRFAGTFPDKTLLLMMTKELEELVSTRQKKEEEAKK